MSTPCPQGGWLDGALGVMAAVEVLRSAGSPARTVALVDWADEEGARFGRSLLGSSAFAGTLDIGAVRGLTDADGLALPDVLAEHGVSLEEMPSAGADLRERLVAYLELHIEQGPVLEAEGAGLRRRAGHGRAWSATAWSSRAAPPMRAPRRWIAAPTPASRPRA